MSKKPRLAIISTHPIQYNAPWFALLAKEADIDLKVFYTWSQRQSDLYDEKFGKEVNWDIPLLEGYNYDFVENISKNPGSHRRRGIVCPGLIKAIEQYQATHLLVFGWNFKAHMKAMRYFKGKVPVLFRGDSTLLDEHRGVRRLLRRIVLKYIYKNIDLALYTGKANKEYYLKHGLSENQLVLAPHAIDNDRFIKKHGIEYRKEAKVIREKLEIKENDFVFLFVGKFEPVKDLQTLLKAFQDYQKNSIRSIKLLLVGNGVLEKDLRSLAHNDPDIIFMPFQNQSMMPVVYRLGHTLCLTSESETWGLVVNEAMACGLGCIVSDKVGCAPDLGVLEGNQIFKSGSIEELQKAMDRAILSKGIDQESFLANWNFERIVKATLTVLQNDA